MAEAGTLLRSSIHPLAIVPRVWVVILISGGRHVEC